MPKLLNDFKGYDRDCHGSMELDYKMSEDDLDWDKIHSIMRKDTAIPSKIKPKHYELPVKVRLNGKPQIVLIECGDILKALNQPFFVSNAIKYLWRAGKKEGESYKTDIEKAIQCLKEELK